MSLIAKAGNGTTFEAIEQGSHFATCVGVIDLGTQTQKNFKGDGTTEKEKILLMFDVADEFYTDENGNEHHRTISSQYTKSLSDRANLRKHLENWRGKAFTDEELQGFDLKNLLGVPCCLNVVHNEKGYANIDSIIKLRKGQDIPQVELEQIYFDLDEFESLNKIDDLPEWICKMIKKSKEWQEIMGSGNAEENKLEVNEDNMPF